MDGWVIVGTKLDTKQLEKDLKSAERKLQNYEKESEKLLKQQKEIKIKVDADTSEYKKKIDTLYDEYQQEIELATSFNYGVDEDKKAAIEAKYQQRLNETNMEYQKSITSLNEINKKIQENAKNQALVKNEIQETNQKLQQTTAYDNARSELDKIGNSINNVIKKVTRWGLAVFGIRGAYMAVRNAINIISQDDEKLSAELDYMKRALAYTIEPVVRSIVSFIKQLMTYVAYIVRAWTGRNIFESANKSLKNANANAQKLSKTLAGFDEMNVLNDNGSTGVLGGVSNFDFTDLDNAKIPDWIKWIADNKELLLNIGAGLAAAFALTKITKWLNNLGILFTGRNGLNTLSTKLSSIGVIAGGIAITSIVAKKVWDEAKELKKEIQQIRNSGAEAQEKWIAGENNINNLILTGNVNRQAGYDLLGKTDGLLYKITGLGAENLKTAKQVSINIGKQIEKQMELYNAGKLDKDQKEKVLGNIIDQIKYNNEVIKKLKEQGKETKTLEDQNLNLANYANTIFKEVNNTKEDLININDIKLDDKKVKIDVETEKAENKFSNFLERLKKNLLKVLTGGFTLDIGFGGGGGGGRGFAKGGIIYHNLPKLAAGGIINQPGRGVPLGSAIGGERGAEGVIPLTDSQQMALLGEAIGKYITINANITNTMNGRVISRELQKITNNSDFAFNR